MDIGVVEYPVTESVSEIMAQIIESQNRMNEAFIKHNEFVNKALERITMLKTESTIVKIKDPLQELKRITKLDSCNLEYMVDLLCIYEDDKISATFKEVFLENFKKLVSESSRNLKDRIIKVKDIRWLILEMEKYPHIFTFTDDDIKVMQENGASRDNILLVKKILKKDGSYEEYYEDSNNIKTKYSMNNGSINGLMEEFYVDGSLKATRNYCNGQPHGETRTWYKNGVLQTFQQFKNGWHDGEYNAWHENGKPMYTSTYINGRRNGEFKEWYQNGKLMSIRNFKMGLQVGEYKAFYESGNPCIDALYDDHGKKIYYNQ